MACFTRCHSCLFSCMTILVVIIDHYRFAGRRLWVHFSAFTGRHHCRFWHRCTPFALNVFRCVWGEAYPSRHLAVFTVTCAESCSELSRHDHHHNCSCQYSRFAFSLRSVTWWWRLNCCVTSYTCPHANCPNQCAYFSPSKPDRLDELQSLL